MNLPMPGLHLYVYTIRMAAERFSTATAQDISIFWMEKQEMFLTATRSVRESSKHLLLYIKVIWLWEPEIVRYGGWNCSDAVPPHFIYALERVLSHLLDRRAKLAQRIYRVYSDLIAQRIFVDRARPFWAHSWADGRITSLE